MKKKCFLIGDPVDHSLSPKMQNAAFRALSLDIVYLAKKVKSEELATIVEMFKEEDSIGANVTIPHKEKIMHFFDKMDVLAEKIGAVNTIVNTKGILKGFNTDALGFSRVMKEQGVGLKEMKVVLIGAGGAAKAITFQCLSEKAKVVIANRTLEKAKRIKERFDGKINVVPLSNKNKLQGEITNADILINATSVGMTPQLNKSLVPEKMLHPELVVVDIIYNPRETKLLKEAKKRDCKTINGVEMLVQQGAIAVELWTGKKAPVELMRKVISTELKNER